jgi:hypothetical protein
MIATHWHSLGLYVDEVPSPTFTVDGESEDVVLFPVETPREDAVPLAEEQIIRDGRTYDVQRWITWVEDEDGEGDGQDLKRLVVIVGWDAGTGPRTMRIEGLRSPLPTEVLDLVVDFDLVENTSISPPGPEFALNADFENDAQIRVVIVVGEAGADVELAWRDRVGNLETEAIPSTDPGGNTTREVTLAPGRSSFVHGPVSLVVTAEGTDGQLASNTATINFYQDLAILAPTVTPSADTIAVDCDGLPMDDIVIDVPIEGMTGTSAFADGVTLQWTTDLDGTPRPTVPLGVRSADRQPWGGIFRFVVGADEVAMAGTTFQQDEVVTFTIDASREAQHPTFEAATSFIIPGMDVVQVPSC